MDGTVQITPDHKDLYQRGQYVNLLLIGKTLKSQQVDLDTKKFKLFKNCLPDWNSNLLRSV